MTESGLLEALHQLEISPKINPGYCINSYDAGRVQICLPAHRPITEPLLQGINAIPAVETVTPDHDQHCIDVSWTQEQH